MANVSIKVVGPWLPWDDRARTGRLERADGSATEVLLHPGLSQGGLGLGAPSFAAAREEGRRIGALAHPLVLHLKQVMEVGGGSVTVYDGFAGASLARVGQALGAAGRRLPLRVVLELVARVAQALVATTEAPQALLPGARPVIHPGVTPAMVLLSRDGSVKVAGFRAPQAGDPLSSPPGYGPPEGEHGPAAVAYALGALTAELLAGEAPPPAAADAEKHAAIVRRVLIAVLARPGVRVPEAVVEVIRGCLSFAPQERPAPAAVEESLRSLARELPQDDLSIWCPEALSRLWPTLITPPEGAASLARSLPMAVGSLPMAVGPLFGAPGLLASTEADTVERGAELGPDGPTAAEDTEEVMRTQELVEPQPEVTVASGTPSPGVRSLGSGERRTAPPLATASLRAGGLGDPGAIAPGAAGEPGLIGLDVALGLSAGADANRPPGRSSGGAISPAGAAGMGGAGMGSNGPVPAEPTDGELEWPPRRRLGPWLLGLGAAALLAALGWRLLGPGAVAVPELPTEPGTETLPVDAPPAEASAEPTAAEPTQAEPTQAEPAEAEPAEAAAAAPTGAALSDGRVAAPPAASETPVPAPRGSASAEPAAARAARTDRAVVPEPVLEPVVDQAWTRPAAPAAPAEPVLVELGPESGSTGEPALPTASTVQADIPAPPPYTLRFRSAYDGIARLDVQCHEGRLGTGLDVVISDAVPGPCRVEATTVDGGHLVALVTAVGDRTWSCFEGGQRSCR